MVWNLSPEIADLYTHTIYAHTVPESRGECDDAVPDTFPPDKHWADLTKHGGDGRHDIMSIGGEDP